MGEGGFERSEKPGEGSGLSAAELHQQIFQYGVWVLEHIIVPIARNAKSLGKKAIIPLPVNLWRMLTAIDLDDKPSFETHEVQNVGLEGHLPAEFEMCQASISKQAPHRCFGIRWRTAHLLGEAANTRRNRMIVLRHALTRLRCCAAEPPSPGTANPSPALSAQTPHPVSRCARNHPLPQGERGRLTRGEGKRITARWRGVGWRRRG